jgi:hypothetical protein
MERYETCINSSNNAFMREERKSGRAIEHTRKVFCTTQKPQCV